MVLVSYDLSEYVWNGNIILRLKQKIKAVLERIGQRIINPWARNDIKLHIFRSTLIGNK